MLYPKTISLFSGIILGVALLRPNLSSYQNFWDVYSEIALKFYNCSEEMMQKYQIKSKNGFIYIAINVTIDIDNRKSLIG